MEDTNAQPAAEPVVEQTPTQETQSEPATIAAEQTSEPTQVVEQPAESTPQPVAETAPSQDKQYNDYTADISQFLNPSQPQIQPDEEGYIDPNKFYQTVMQDVERKLEFQRTEERNWQKVEKQYPEIVEDKELRDLVHAARLNDVTRGGKGDLEAAAKQVFNKLQAYKSQGKAQAQISETVQKSATLQTQTAKSTPATTDSDLIDRMSRGDKVASETLISKWLDEGKL